MKNIRVKIPPAPGQEGRFADLPVFSLIQYFFCFIPDFGKWEEGIRFFGVRQAFFHPDHVVPAVKFPAAFFKAAHEAEVKGFVEMEAVHGKVWIFIVQIGNAGVKVVDLLQGKDVHEFFQKDFSDALMAAFFGKVQDRKSVV